MTNEERADLLFSEAPGIAREMRMARDERAWNLATRRAQEVLEPVVKALLSEMGVEYPRTHDPAPVLGEAMQQRHLDVDPALLDWLPRLSKRLADLRAPAFYHEVPVSEADAREYVEGAERVLAFGHELMGRLRGGTA